MHTTDWLGKLIEQVDQTVDRVLGSYQPRPYRGDKIVRDAIWGVTSCFPHELALIDSPLMQRLRKIHQTSLAFFTYPCSVHSRFEHSLGVLAAVEKILQALRERHVPVSITEVDYLEVRLAALLHDITHGPLSHSSEAFYQEDPIFDHVRGQYPALFGSTRQPRASASEILTYALLTGKRFASLWQEILDTQQSDSRWAPHLTQCDWTRIATAIIGEDSNPIPGASSFGNSKRYLRQIINGPFDVDKLDYTARDSYFTGLSIIVDVERLLWTIDTFDVPNENTQCLCVSPSGAMILEQVLFAKMQLYSSLYHHHKVRVAHQSFVRFLHFLKKRKIKVRGALVSPVAFLGWDDYDVLHGCTGDEKADDWVRSIMRREFPLRALVLSYSTWGPEREPDDSYQKQFDREMGNVGAIRDLEKEIEKAAHAAAGSVWVDIPREPSLMAAASEALVKFDERTSIPLQSMHPVSGWLSSYARYRSVSYVFAPHDIRASVTDKAIGVLKEHKIIVNANARTLARL